MNKGFGSILLGVLGVTIARQDIHFFFQLTALIIPTCYALWRWYRDCKKDKSKEI